MESSPPTNKPEDIEEAGFRAVAPEAHQLHGKKLPPEHIGQVLVAADMETGSEADKRHSRNAAVMSRSELLDLSEEIRVDNTTLRHIYETHLIGENGLRRLVYENMRGGNLQVALHHEILEHQTDFEKDPNLRRQLLRDDQQLETVGLKDLLRRAGIVEAEGLTAGKTEHAKAAPTSPEHLERHLIRQAHQRRLLDLAFVSIILILLLLVILLAVIRR